MSKLKSIANTLRAWLTNWSKSRISLLFLASLAFFSLAASPNIRDQAQVINHKNENIVAGENRYWRKTKPQPRLILISQKSLTKMQPAHLNRAKKTVYIVVGQAQGRRSVQIFSSRDLHSAFTRTVRLNMIAAKKDKLTATNNKEFNAGLEFVIRACITQINQHYDFSSQTNTLTLRERVQLNHPRRLRIAIIAGLVLVLAVFIFFYHKWRRPRSSLD